MNIFKIRVTSDLVVNSLCALGIGAGTAEYSLDVFASNLFIKYFKEAYKNGQPVALSESNRKRLDNVIQDLKYTDFQKAFITPFTAEGLGPVNVGCLNTRSGCYIGIPNSYNIKSLDDISDDSDAKLELQEYLQLINEDSKTGQMFMQSLILSDSAKKYSIARELVLTDTFRVLLKSISYSLSLLPMCALGTVVLSSLPAKPAKFRAFAFFVLCNVGIVVCLLIRVALENYYQNDADSKVASISKEYIYGGIEYYEKLIQRNLALRNIVPDGESMYSEKGDQLAFISLLSELPLTFRKKQLERKLQKCLEEDKKIE